MTLRALLQSSRFDQAWALLSETYRQEVIVPDNVVAFPCKRPADESMSELHPTVSPLMQRKPMSIYLTGSGALTMNLVNLKLRDEFPEARISIDQNFFAQWHKS